MLRVLALLILVLLPIHDLGHEQKDANLPNNNPAQQTPQVSPQNYYSYSCPTEKCGDSKAPPWWKDPQVYLAILGFPTLCVVIWQAVKAHQAADAAKSASQAAARQVDHMIASERPFVLIEVRNNTELWVRNCGKSAARFIYYDPTAIKLGYPEFDSAMQDHVMRQPPYYGEIYSSQTMIQINTPWLAPGDSREFTYFDLTILSDLDDRTKAEIGRGHRAIRFYSAIKYRGIASPDIFETRFCYGYTAQRGLYMAGPYGYNENT